MTAAASTGAVAVHPKYGSMSSDRRWALRWSYFFLILFAIFFLLLPVVDGLDGWLRMHDVIPPKLEDAFPALFDQFAAATAGMTDQQRAQALASFLQADALDVATIASKEGGDAILDLTDKMNVSGSAAENSAQRMDNFKGSLEQLKGAIETAQILIGNMLLPVARQLVDGITKLVTVFLQLPAPIQKAVAAGVGLVGMLSLAGGGFILLAPKILATVNAVRTLSTEIPVLAKALRLLSVASPWILAIVAALALLGLAYKLNLFGFGDAVDKVVDKVQHFAKVFKSQFDLISKTGNYDGVVSAFRALGFALADLTGWNPKKLVDAFTGIGRAVDRAFKAVKKITCGFSEMFGAILEGDWQKALQKLRKTLAGIGDLLASPAKAIGSALKNISTGFKPLDDALHNLGKVCRRAQSRRTPLRSFHRLPALLRRPDRRWAQSRIRAGQGACAGSLGVAGGRVGRDRLGRGRQCRYCPHHRRTESGRRRGW